MPITEPFNINTFLGIIVTNNVASIIALYPTFPCKEEFLAYDDTPNEDGNPQKPSMQSYYTKKNTLEPSQARLYMLCLKQYSGKSIRTINKSNTA